MSLFLMAGGLATLAGYEAAHGITAAQAGGLTPPGNPGREPVPPPALMPLFREAASGHGVPVSLLLAVAAQESGYQPRAHSSAGADGIMQMLPSSFREYSPPGTPSEAIWDPATEIDAAAAMLAADGAARGEIERALFDYNHDLGYVREVAARQADYEAWLRGGGRPASAGLLWPLRGPITQRFGCTGVGREPSRGSCPHFHTGLDIAAPAGSTVVAACSGEVITAADSSSGFGVHVVVRCDGGQGVSTLYGHLSGRIVDRAEVVVQGQALGYEGSTGNSSGPHLHFEVDSGGEPTDPLPYLGG